jgi:photosystem II stability/assembly factor-like uncharacterized protein
MNKIIFLLIIFLSTSLEAQWKKIADFPYDDGGLSLEEAVQVVYFIDLPGPPKIGFIGTTAAVYKTTDGGNSFNRVWYLGGHYDYHVTDICFKDTLTGWFTIFDGGGASADTVGYKTTDGGNSWKPMKVPSSIWGSMAVYYNKLKNQLYLSESDTAMNGTEIMMVSNDLGNTWAPTNFRTYGFSFSSDSNGIAAADQFPDTEHAIFFTRDGGATWTEAAVPAICPFPLAVPGTPSCFTADEGRIIVRRSDDYGKSWRVLKDFGPVADSHFNQIAPSGNGMIGGDLSRLYILTDSGMYLSTDEGSTWKLEPGSPLFTGYSTQIFYCAKGVTIVGASVPYSNGNYSGAGLWEETWPTSGVAELAPAASVLRVFPNPAAQSIRVESASGPIVLYDPLGRLRIVPATPQGGGITLDVSTLPAGIYYVSDGVSRVKFVKK